MPSKTVYQNTSRCYKSLQAYSRSHITMEKYGEIIGDCCTYWKWIDGMIIQHPELFPDVIRDGYRLHDERSSEKLGGVMHQDKMLL